MSVRYGHKYSYLSDCVSALFTDRTKVRKKQLQRREGLYNWLAALSFCHDEVEPDGGRVLWSTHS